jgi:hypothetical protein
MNFPFLHQPPLFLNPFNPSINFYMILNLDLNYYLPIIIIIIVIIIIVIIIIIIIIIINTIVVIAKSINVIM